MTPAEPEVTGAGRDARRVWSRGDALLLGVALGACTIGWAAIAGVLLGVVYVLAHDWGRGAEFALGATLLAVQVWVWIRSERLAARVLSDRWSITGDASSLPAVLRRVHEQQRADDVGFLITATWLIGPWVSLLRLGLAAMFVLGILQIADGGGR